MKLIASPNFNNRNSETTIDYIILHYTAMATATEAIERLCGPENEVSAHYIISKDGCVTQMVDERLRAWHAGESCWQGLTDINSRSIGIELDNKGDEPFPIAQINSLKALVKNIMKKHELGPESLLGHSDIAPARKQDPGPHFPWKELTDEGLCLPRPLTGG